MSNSSNIIWDLQANKVTDFLKEGKRIDGRKLDEFREITVTKNISENADGSARVRLGATDVVAGIKIVPDTPYPDTPDQGTIAVGAELLPIASPEFEVGPPREDAIELARVVDRGIRESGCIDFKNLCIREGEKSWVVFIDFYVLNHDGNLFDASSIAALASLLNAKMPKLEDDKIVRGEYTGNLELSCKPLLCTFAKISNKIILDPMFAEEAASQARFSMASTEDNCLIAFQKGGSGTFNAKEVEEMAETAIKKSKEIRKKL